MSGGWWVGRQRCHHGRMLSWWKVKIWMRKAPKEGPAHPGGCIEVLTWRNLGSGPTWAIYFSWTWWSTWVPPSLEYLWICENDSIKEGILLHGRRINMSAERKMLAQEQMVGKDWKINLGKYFASEEEPSITFLLTSEILQRGRRDKQEWGAAQAEVGKRGKGNKGSEGC